MGDFDAGSIDATLDVDRTPFTRGLELAKEQAAEFEDDGINIEVHLDDGDALVGFDDLEIRADELDGRDINLHVNVDGTAEAEAEMAAVRREADGGNGRGGLVGAFSLLNGPAGVLSGGIMPAAALTALGALPGLLGAAGGAAIGLGGAFAIAAGGLLPFGLIAKSDFTDMQASLKDLTKQQQALNTATTDAQRTAALQGIAKDTAALQGPAGAAAKAFQLMEGAFSKLKTDTAPGAFGVMGQFFTLASNLLPKLEPLINATATALSGVATQLSTAISGPGFTKFITFLTSNIGPILGSLSTAFGSFGGGLAAALEKSQPLIDLMVKGLGSFATVFEQVANSPGFDKFIATLTADLPMIGTVLSDVATALLQIFTALGPSVGPATDIIESLVTQIGILAPVLGPLVSSFLTLIDQALTPILPILTILVQSLVPPLVTLFNYLAPLLPPIAQAFADIVEAILPLVPVFGELIATLLPPLVNFIEILVKEGLAPLILQLAQSLAPLLPKIADAFDRIFKALAPLIPVLAGAFIKAIQQMAPQLPGLVNSIAQLAVSFLQLVTALPPSFWTVLLNTTNILSNPLMVGLIEGIAGALTGIANAMTAVVQAFQGTGPIIDWFKNLGSNITKALAGAATWLINTGSNIIGGLWGGIYGYWAGTLLPWLNGLGTWVKNAVNGAIGWLEQTGVDIVHGIWNGIDSAGSWLYNKIVGFVKDHIKSAVTNPLGIWSPSQWMHENVGRNLVLGISGGIDANAHEASAAMGRLANTIKNGGGNISGAYSLTGNVTQTATATAQVAALSQVVGQLSQLVNVTKDLPSQTGAKVKDHLAPVFAQQAQMDHANALQRGRQSAVGANNGS